MSYFTNKLRLKLGTSEQRSKAEQYFYSINEKNALSEAYFKSLGDYTEFKGFQYNEASLKLKFIELANTYCNKYGGGTFNITPINKPILNFLVDYFLESKDICEKYSNNNFLLTEKISLRKGIMIIGSNGTGKSCIMDTFHKLKILNKMFEKVTSNSIVIYYDNNKNYTRYYQRDLYIDDVGIEKKSTFDKTMILSQIIQERYVRNNLRTYITTNLSTDDQLELYGKAYHSRLFEMFNIIYLIEDDYRKKNSR